MNERKTRYIILAGGIIVVIALAFGTFYRRDNPEVASVAYASLLNRTQIWDTQCVDTMKTSRDKARIWSNRPDLRNHIEMEMAAAETIGANCVAIDTSYDPEFLPYLKAWVAGARNHKLAVWFRGNFSSWEGWFGYPRTMTLDEHIQKTAEFIRSNPNLFTDGDIFTPAPEAENGGPFYPMDSSKLDTYASFLKSEDTVVGNVFGGINKKVTVNWFSMNGELAKQLFTEDIVNDLGGVVTLDHYIKEPQEMGAYIKYFHDLYKARVVVGEFGAPIPQINGTMSEEEQAEFIGRVLHELYENHSIVSAVNYWDLYDGPTALLNQDGSLRSVAHVLQSYFIPAQVSGRVIDTLGNPLNNIEVRSQDGANSIRTDKEGRYVLLLPAGSNDMVITGDMYKSLSQHIQVASHDKIEKNITLEPQLATPFYWVAYHLRNIIK